MNVSGRCERLRRLFISGLGDGEGAQGNTQGARDLAALPQLYPRGGALPRHALASPCIYSDILKKGPTHVTAPRLHCLRP